MSDVAEEEWLDNDEESITRPHGVRFGEGQRRGSGRPKGSLNRKTIIKRVANRRRRLMVNGRLRRLTNLEWALHVIRTQAALGDHRAFALQEKLVARFSGPAEQRAPAVLFIPGQMTMEEWFAVYGEPGSQGKMVDPDAVIARFPHLKFLMQQMRAKQAPVLEET